MVRIRSSVRKSVGKRPPLKRPSTRSPKVKRPKINKPKPAKITGLEREVGRSGARVLDKRIARRPKIRSIKKEFNQLASGSGKAVNNPFKISKKLRR